MNSREFSQQDIFQIAGLYESGMNAAEIADRFGVCKWKIYRAINSCREMTGNYPSRKYEKHKRIASIEEVKRVVCAVYKITHNDLLGQRKTSNLMEPRHIAVHLAYKLSGMSLTRVGKSFDGRDHSTVINSVKKAPALYPKQVKRIEDYLLKKSAEKSAHVQFVGN